MIGEETPEKVKEANDARWQEYEKLRRMERKLQGKILEDPTKGLPSPEPTFHEAFPGSNHRERGWNTGAWRDTGRGKMHELAGGLTI